MSEKKDDCVVVKLDVDSPEWKAKMEKIRQDRIRKYGSEEVPKEDYVGYRQETF